MAGFEIIERTPLIDVAIKLTANGFARSPDEEFSEGVKHILENGNLLLSVMDEEETVGYGAFCDHYTAGHTLMHVSSIMIRDDLQGQGIADDVLRVAITRQQPEFLGFKTQSPRAYRAMSKLVLDLSPDISQDPRQPLPEGTLQQVGLALAEQRNLDFPVCYGAYGSSSMYGVSPEHALSKDFKRWCDPSAGDALLCVGQIKPELLAVGE